MPSKLIKRDRKKKIKDENQKQMERRRQSRKNSEDPWSDDMLDLGLFVTGLLGGLLAITQRSRKPVRHPVKAVDDGKVIDVEYQEVKE